MVRVAKHLEEWLQGLTGPAGKVTPARPLRGVITTCAQAPGWVLDDPAGVIGHDRAGAFLSALDLSDRAQIAVAPDPLPGGAAAISATVLRGPANDPTPAVAARLGASGWARARTGSARALLFVPGTVPTAGEAKLSAARYTHAFRFSSRGRA